MSPRTGNFDFSGPASKTFTISDGTNTATVVLDRDVTNLAGLVDAINDAITTASALVTATADGDRVRLTANDATLTITIAGTHGNQFFPGGPFKPTAEQN